MYSKEGTGGTCWEQALMSRPVASGELLPGCEHADRASLPSETDEQLVGRLLREEDDRERGKPNSE